MAKYNRLTERLIKEGYTAENHPQYVYLERARNKDDALDNFHGGFQYYYWYVAEKTYETPCGLVCKGKFTHNGLFWLGGSYCFENDNPTIICPKGCVNCKMRDSPFDTDGTGVLKKTCVVHPTDELWEYDKSCEGELGLYDERIRRARITLELERNGRVCDFHMHYDDESGKMVFDYHPSQCARGFCEAYRGKECPVLGKKLGKEKGNVYYDFEYEGRDYSKDGTLFEGERFHTVIKGVQVFDKPVPLEIARIYADTCADEIRFMARCKTRYIDRLSMHMAETGQKDLSWKITNIRAERKAVMDFEQDLEDIKNGISVVHDLDEKKRAKQEKTRRRRDAKEKRIKAMENKIVRDGYGNLEAADRNRAQKLLDDSRISELNESHLKKIEEERNAPK